MVTCERSSLHANARGLGEVVKNGVETVDIESSIFRVASYAVRCRGLAFSIQATCLSKWLLVGLCLCGTALRWYIGPNDAAVVATGSIELPWIHHDSDIKDRDVRGMIYVDILGRKSRRRGRIGSANTCHSDRPMDRRIICVQIHPESGWPTSFSCNFKSSLKAKSYGSLPKLPWPIAKRLCRTSKGKRTPSSFPPLSLLSPVYEFLLFASVFD